MLDACFSLAYKQQAHSGKNPIRKNCRLGPLPEACTDRIEAEKANAFAFSADSEESGASALIRTRFCACFFLGKLSKRVADIRFNIKLATVRSQYSSSHRCKTSIAKNCRSIRQQVQYQISGSAITISELAPPQHRSQKKTADRSDSKPNVKLAASVKISKNNSFFRSIALFVKKLKFRCPQYGVFGALKNSFKWSV